MAAMTSAQVAMLGTAQLQTLVTSQLSGLTTAQLQNFTRAQFLESAAVATPNNSLMNKLIAANAANTNALNTLLGSDFVIAVNV